MLFNCSDSPPVNPLRSWEKPKQPTLHGRAWMGSAAWKGWLHMFSLFPTDFEASFIRLLDKITNGSRIEINQTGKLLFFLFGKASTYALLNHSSVSHSIWWYTFYIQMETSSFLSVIQLFGDMCEFCQFKGPYTWFKEVRRLKISDQQISTFSFF